MRAAGIAAVLTTYEGVLPGMRAVVPVVGELPYGWLTDLRTKGYAVPTQPQEIFRPLTGYPDAAECGPTFAPPCYTAADSDTAFLTNAVLTYFAEHQRVPWFVHVSYLRRIRRSLPLSRIMPCMIRERSLRPCVPRQ